MRPGDGDRDREGRQRGERESGKRESGERGSDICMERERGREKGWGEAGWLRKVGWHSQESKAVPGRPLALGLVDDGGGQGWDGDACGGHVGP